MLSKKPIKLGFTPGSQLEIRNGDIMKCDNCGYIGLAVCNNCGKSERSCKCGHWVQVCPKCSQ